MLISQTLEFPRYPQGGVAALDGLLRLVLGCCPVGLLGNGPNPLFLTPAP